MTGETAASQAARERRDRWLRLGVKRTDAILRALAVLERCGNRSSYGYTESEVESVFHAIDTALRRAREAFREKPEPDRLRFSESDLIGRTQEA